jgi:hypothetical protein
MRWCIDKSIREADARPIEFLKECLHFFDVRNLESFRLDLGRGTKDGAYGRCYYKTRSRGYRISVQVPGPFPCAHRRYVRPLYPNADGTWPETPPGCEQAGWCKDEKSGKEWIRLTTRYVFETRAIGIIHVGAHEIFHFLRHSRQIPGRNGENEADQWALERTREYRTQLEIEAQRDGSEEFERNAVHIRLG